MPVVVPPEITERLDRLARQLRVAGAVRTELVADAFATVPRHLFIRAYHPRAGERVDVPHDRLPGPDVLDVIYSDRALVTRTPMDRSQTGMSSSSQPLAMAQMLEALELRPGLRVLEIGAGTGYNAALVHTITGAQVITLDPTPGVAGEATEAFHRVGITDVTAHDVDGYHGYPDAAPYDRIIATVGVGGIPPAWVDQLSTDGLILAPTWHGGLHPSITIRAGITGGHLIGHGAVCTDFMPAAGALHPSYQPPSPLTPGGDPVVVPHPFGTLDDEGYYHLWFAAAAHDPRVTRLPVTGHAQLGQCALATADCGTVLVQRDAIRGIDADPDLIAHAETLVTWWARHARPRIPDWTIHLQLRDGLHIPHRFALATPSRPEE